MREEGQETKQGRQNGFTRFSTTSDDIVVAGYNVGKRPNCTERHERHIGRDTLQPDVFPDTEGFE